MIVVMLVFLMALPAQAADTAQDSTQAIQVSQIDPTDRIGAEETTKSPQREGTVADTSQTAPQKEQKPMPNKSNALKKAGYVGIGVVVGAVVVIGLLILALNSVPLM